jgi:prepilin-type N-terminal cleavage/methylation domain-containing protein
MKPSISKRRHSGGFTLVELLVVMGIIAILAAVVIAGVSSAIKFAKRTRANATCVQIQTGMQNYYTEYGVYAASAADTATATDLLYSGATGTDTARWQNLMWALCGNINPLTGAAVTTGTVPNTRNIQYLAPTRSDLDTVYGIPANPFGSSATTPYYYMAVDNDYSGVVGDSGAALAKLPNFTASSTNYTGTTLPSGTPGGIAVWCSCDQPLIGTAASPSHPYAWAHTY